MDQTLTTHSWQPGPKKFKAHSLTGRIDSHLLSQAWRQVRRNRGAAGIDRVSLDTFQAQEAKHLAEIQQELRQGTYQPRPLRRVYIPKPDGSQRPLAIPTVRDRVAQEVLRRLLEPHFEPLFHEHSYGFRPGRSAHDALQQVEQYRQAGYRYVVDADITACFDSIPLKTIMQTLSWEIADGKVLTHIENFLKAGVVEDGVLHPSEKGTPQGGPLSPLIANIVLNRLDWQLTHAGYHFVRYADDFVILCQTQHQAEDAYALAQQVLRSLGLELSEAKTRITHFGEGFDFLGFHLHRAYHSMKAKAVRKFKDKVKALTIRKENLQESVIQQLNHLIRGTANYFGHPDASTRYQFQRLDRFVRRRIRCMKTKRIWRTDNYRFPNSTLEKWGLLSLVELQQQRAVLSLCGATSRGPPGAGKPHAGK